MATKFDGVDAPYSAEEGLPWLPFSPHAALVSVKLYAADPAREEVVVLLRAPPGIELPPHRSTGATTIYTLQGRWKYREHDWVAGPGSVVLEPAGIRHTPVVLADGTDDTILFVVNVGDLQLLDADDQVIGIENWRSAIVRYLDYCRANGITPRDLTRRSDSGNPDRMRLPA
jgi:quercetin dioxygenase-like cupin family protein